MRLKWKPIRRLPQTSPATTDVYGSAELNKGDGAENEGGVTLKCVRTPGA